jgi:hypothetical protein
MNLIANQVPISVDIANVIMTIADIVVTVIGDIIVAILANSHWRQQILRVAEKHQFIQGSDKLDGR